MMLASRPEGETSPSSLVPEASPEDQSSSANSEMVPVTPFDEPVLGAAGADEAARSAEPATAEAAPASSASLQDEDAAMRAIEGGWSRVRARALPDVPEFTDLGAAVAAAQSAVEQVLAQAGIDDTISQPETKPSGLSRPRLGARDDLKRINGLGELDESSLNNLGIFHFDQIAQWSETEVHWVENHVFVRGRVGREDWQQQARRLSSETTLRQAAFSDPTA